MFKILGEVFCGRKNVSRPFRDYYNEWFATLRNTLLPQLRRALSSAQSPTILATHVDAMLHHFQAYYEALDLAASNNIAQLLFPGWRNSLESPFLWLGDFHPHLFTNLFRSFLEVTEESEEDNQIIVASFRQSRAYLDKPWHVLMAWDCPSETLLTRIDQIECGMRLTVPSLVARARQAQAAFVERVGAEWGRCQGRKEEMKAAIGEAMKEEMEELVSVFVDANRLRSSVLADILNATNIYQAALFFEGLAQFLVGFHDHKLLREFQKCKTTIN